MIELEEVDVMPEETPEEMRDMMAALEAENQRRVDALGKTVARLRDDAVTARKSSGIETIWREDEEYYSGIDEANRNTTAWTKAAGITGGLEGGSRKDDDSRCTSFFNLIGPFVDTAAARMGDILLPSGDWNFSIGPTPVPEIADQLPQPMPPQSMHPGQPQQPNQPPPGGFFTPQQKPLSSDQRVEKVEKRIHDWLTECAYHSELRKVIHDMARIGTGIIKGPVAGTKKTSGGMEIVPMSYRVDPDNFFHDPNCGENIHDGEFVIERELSTARKLRDLKGLPGYLPECIDKVIDEGPGKRNYTSDGVKSHEFSTKDDDRFEVWYFHGFVDVDDLESCGVNVDEEDRNIMPAVVTLVNDTVIRASLNPLEDGAFPYDLMAWRRRAGSVHGVGVSRQGRTPQDMLNASFRAMMDNAGISSGPQIIFRMGTIIPADGDYTLRPRKVWIASDELGNRPVTDALAAINIPSMQAELAAMVQMAKKEMEDATGIAFLLMGQQGSAPDTVGGMELVNKNASAFLREKARTFDESITEPHIKRYNDWLQAYGPEDERGELVIRAIGSSALVEREIQSMETMQILQMSANPAFGIDPAKAIKEYLKAKRFDPEKFEYDDEQKAKMAQTPPPPPPQVQVAQINSQASIQRAQIAAQATVEKSRLDTDRDTKHVEALTNQTQVQASTRITELQLKREIAYLELQVRKGIELDANKVKLADTAMKLRTTKELAFLNATAKQLPTPPVEPPGRARNGMSFTE